MFIFYSNFCCYCSLKYVVNKLLFIKITELWTSLVVQWIRTRLLMQGTQVQPPVRESSAATEHWSLCATAPEPLPWSLHVTQTGAHEPGACAPEQEKAPRWEAWALRRRVAPLTAAGEGLCRAMSAQRSQNKTKQLAVKKIQQNSDCACKGRFPPLYQNFFFPNYFYKCMPCTEFLAYNKYSTNKWMKIQQWSRQAHFLPLWSFHYRSGVKY